MFQNYKLIFIKCTVSQKKHSYYISVTNYRREMQFITMIMDYCVLQNTIQYRIVTWSFNNTSETYNAQSCTGIEPALLPQQTNCTGRANQCATVAHNYQCSNCLLKHPGRKAPPTIHWKRWWNIQFLFYLTMAYSAAKYAFTS